MLVLTDQLKRKIKLQAIPKKIISLVPSQTELLYDLGLDEEVIGITKFCVHPDAWHRGKTRVGGTKQIDFERISGLNPEIIICNKEENDMLQVSELMKHFSVWVSDVKNLDDALEMTGQIGKLVGKENQSEEIMRRIKQEFNMLNEVTMLVNKNKNLCAAYLIWKNPVMTVGGDTFIHDMMIRCKLKNIFKDRNRYPEITVQELADSSPDLILLSSEPFPFKKIHMEEFSVACPKSKLILVDGEYFSWYGSRLLKAPYYFRSLVKQIYPGI